jgi:SAM-dependent methyltransferase
MSNIRPYFPLIGFVVPTVVVGYGFVIPRSCIAGWNELTIGFGTTIVGAALTYVAGQRLVLPKRGTKPPLRVRMARAMNRQAACPSGWFGRLLGWVWPREHGRLNAEAIDRLDVRHGHSVLEIGPGTGHALREIARRADGGRVVGVDASELMAKLCRRRNRRAIARGSVEVQLGDIESRAISLERGSFDRVLSVNCIYFWRDLGGVVAKIAAALKPGGKLVLVFRPEGDDIPERFRGSTYRFPRIEDVDVQLRRAGLSVAQPVRASANPSALLVVATKPT